MLNFHKITVKLKPSYVTPLPFIGSTLRGAFGVSLKKVSCINPSYECKGCFAKDNCLYYEFFEEKNKAHKYRFDIELNPKNYDFSLYLFEDATIRLPYVVTALHKMLTELGLTKDRKTFEIDKIFCNDISIYHDGKFDLKDIKPLEFTVDEIYEKCRVVLKTPLRIKHNGKLLSKTPPLEVLLLSVQNRLNELKDMPKTKLSFSPKYKIKSSDISFLDFTRRSNRQKRSLQIGGIVGFVEFSEIDAKSFLLLKLGEVLGVGKQTVFGLGKVEVVEV